MKFKLNYPIIVLPKKDNMMYVYLSEKKFMSTNEDLFKKIDYKNLDIVDCLGHQYKINNALKVKYLGLWGYNPLLKGRQILIDFEYESEIEILLLEEFKEEIIKRIDNNKRFWESGWDIQELKQNVYKKSTFRELAEILK